MSMNGGNVGKVVEALKVNPMTLALVVLVGVFLFFVNSSVQQNRKDIHEVMKIMVERCIGK